MAHGHPAWSFFIENDNMIPMLGWDALRTRSQDLSPAVTLNGLIYVFSAEQVRQGGQLITENTIPYLAHDEEESIEVDTPFQWRVAELIASRRELPKIELRLPSSRADLLDESQRLAGPPQALFGERLSN